MKIKIHLQMCKIDKVENNYSLNNERFAANSIGIFTYDKKYYGWLFELHNDKLTNGFEQCDRYDELQLKNYSYLSWDWKEMEANED